MNYGGRKMREYCVQIIEFKINLFLKFINKSIRTHLSGVGATRTGFG